MMQDDQVFRLILIAFLVVLLPVGAYFRIRSRATREALDRRQEGLFILFTLRPVATLRLLGLMAFAANPAWMAWSSLPLPTWLRWTGVVAGLVTGVLWVWTFRSLGKNLTDTVVTRKDHALVTSGPYRWVRHPLYLGFALAVVADTLVTSNWFVSLTATATVALLMVRTRTEEEKLVERFGDAYLDYRERTGQFLPRVSGF